MAQKAHIQIEQGTDFSAQIEISSYYNLTGYNLTDVSVTAQLRKHWESVNVYNFEIYVTDANSGYFIIAMPNELTSTIEPGRYMYDIVLTHNNSNLKYRLVEGIAHVLPGITR